MENILCYIMYNNEIWVLCLFTNWCVIETKWYLWTLSIFYKSHINFFAVCLNSNWSLRWIINVLNVTIVETPHSGLDVLSSMLLLMAGILAATLGMQLQKKFNMFIWKWRFWRNWHIFLSKDIMSSSKLGCLLNYQCNLHLMYHLLF